ncbi:MAG: shikimate dehydrogenase [Actinobacteria bacterium]|nr:shikimate dehydrogenase [Actinomycetota bacterium]MCG2819966.1 shikimate dehydrogenase [Actinomycetes bacterium]MBU4179826.1 shikimate dehydrogenase [Actinomycetota bacterium]MBU4218947.1 shikimate dehydrogenase [Actinomycetota bacterium]MBU4357960.1 shikimate dehydrogenase [Actinomycetota bacterium]
MRIDGETRLVGIIGNPLDNTLSPTIHNAAFDYMGLNWCYVPLTVQAEHLREGIEGIKALRFTGVNVTMPFKTDVLDMLDDVAMFAETVGAVNTILVDKGRLIGYNTDGRGFYTALTRDVGYEVKGARVLIMGAGGAARSVTVSLALGGCASIVIVNRTVGHSEQLAGVIRQSTPDIDVDWLSPDDDYDILVAESDIIINATPLTSFNGSVLRIPVSMLNRNQVVCDLNYSSYQPPLLQEAEARGARVIDGKGMLLYQAAAAFEIWTGLEAPVEVMRVALLKALEEAHI